MPVKACIICGKEFSKPCNCSKKSWETTKFCSHECYWKSLKNKPSIKKGISVSEEQKKKQSQSMKGHTPWNKNKEWLEMRGEKHPRWNGGRKISKIRSQNKRNRNLGFDQINEQINDDEVAHHLTKEFVAFVPIYINKSCKHNIWTGKNMDEVNFYTLNYLFLVYKKEEK